MKKCISYCLIAQIHKKLLAEVHLFFDSSISNTPSKTTCGFCGSKRHHARTNFISSLQATSISPIPPTTQIVMKKCMLIAWLLIHKKLLAAFWYAKRTINARNVNFAFFKLPPSNAIFYVYILVFINWCNISEVLYFNCTSRIFLSI
jgi:hypothetical protein